MRSFTCDTCGQLVFFHNDTCLRCGSALGFRPSAREVEVLGDADLRCATHATSGCNWIVEPEGGWYPNPGDQCRSCRQTRTVPPLDDDTMRAAYRDTEMAKRAVLFQLLELGLPLDVAEFDLLSSRVDDSVMIGHEAGLITIDVAETDDARRERARDDLDEPYRTVTGHVRHELGHALFDRLVTPDAEQDVRAAFGDWTADYQASLDRHYSEGPPDGWQQDFVSAYATMHPAEDWAETFAHLLHISDTLQTADAYGLRIDPSALDAWTHARLTAGIEDDGTVAPAPVGSLRSRLDVWLPLTYALNAVNRSMGDGDLYPFVLTEPVIRKLELVDRLVAAHAGR